MPRLKHRVAPIDIDFAGWTEVEAGEHNAWGVIATENNHESVVAWFPVKVAADKRAAELNGDA